MLKLTKRVPARKKTEVFRWCAREFKVMSPRYRAIRSKAKNKMDKCYWCNHPFTDGETMALAAREKGPNVVLCQTCVVEAAEERADE